MVVSVLILFYAVFTKEKAENTGKINQKNESSNIKNFQDEKKIISDKNNKKITYLLNKDIKNQNLKILENFINDLVNKKIYPQVINEIYGINIQTINDFRELINQQSKIIISQAKEKNSEKIWSIDILENNIIKQRYYLQYEEKPNTNDKFNLLTQNQWLAEQNKVDNTNKVSENLATTTIQKFINAIKERDFEKLSQTLHNKHNINKKIAALLIIIEDGNFLFPKEKTFIKISENNKTAWFLLNLNSEKLGKKTDFGVEMLNINPENDKKEWKITALNFSKMLSLMTDKQNYQSPIINTQKTKFQPGQKEKIVLYFNFDDAQLSKQAQNQLKIISDILKNHNNKKIKIEGHADTLGERDYNFNLSYRRAMAVKYKLIKFGINAKQIDTEAFGEDHPVDKNFSTNEIENEIGQQKNRRAEIFLDF